jgi:uncharacterized protein YjbJ (UPF0337 family)
VRNAHRARDIASTALACELLEHRQEALMNEDTLKGQWKQLKGQIQIQWGRLTNDDIDQIQGNRDILLGKLQEYYGKSREESERDLERWLEASRVQRV